jgi:hypothetical protein
MHIGDESLEVHYGGPYVSRLQTMGYFAHGIESQGTRSVRQVQMTVCSGNYGVVLGEQLYAIVLSLGTQSQYHVLSSTSVFRSVILLSLPCSLPMNIAHAMFRP